MKRFLLSIFLLVSTHFMIAASDDAQRVSHKTHFRDPAPVPQDPLLMRVYADPYVNEVSRQPGAGTPGSLDETFGTNGGRDLTSVFGVNAKAQAIRILSNGTFLIAVNDPNNNQVKVARFDGDGNLDATFGSSGICTIAQQNVTSIYIDAQNRIVVTGANNGSWIARLTSSGTLDVLFGVAGITSGTNSDGFYAIGEQQSGRLVVAAKDDVLGGVVYAFRADGILDQSFGAALAAYGSRGKIAIADAATTGIYDLVIDPATDAMYIAYVDGSARAAIAKVLADGNAYDTSFGSSGAIASANRISSVASESQVRIVRDQNGKLVLAAVNTSNQYVVRRYNANGSVDTSFNSDGSALTIAATATAFLTHAMMTQANQILLLGYQNNADNRMFLARINSNGTLDTAFSSNGVLPYELNTVDTIRQARYSAIHPTGQILLVGYEYDVDEEPSAADNPVAVRVYGDSYVPEYKQAPGASLSGTLDTTFNAGTDATVVVSSLTGLSSLANTTPKLMHTFYQNPGYLLVTQSGTSVYLAKLKQDLSLDATFNDGAVATVTTTNLSRSVNGIAFDLYSGVTDSAQHFFLVGTDTVTGSTEAWAQRISSAGVVDADFDLNVGASGLITGNSIAQQSFGRTLIAGATSAQGILAGFKTDGSLDLGFGNGTGYFVVTPATAIYAMVVDGQDRIVIAYKDSSNNLSVARIQQSGLGYDTTFNVTDKISSVASADQVKVSLDHQGDIVVAAATATGYKVRRYAASTGAKDETFNGSGELAFQFSTSTGTPVLTQLTVESSGKILVLGYNSAVGDKRGIQARLLSTGALDTTFNADGSTPGILEIYNGTEQFQFVDEGIQLDRRLMLFGNDGATGNILLTRVFGDDSDYVTAIEDEPVAGINGGADLSLQGAGSADLTSLVGAYKVKLIRAIAGGKTLIAIDNGTTTKLVRLTPESTLDSTFSGSGISTTTCPTGVFDMFVDSNGKILVAGASGTSGRGANAGGGGGEGGGGSSESWLRRYNADGSNDTTFGTSGLVATTITAGYSIKDQQGGRVLVGGLEDTVGRLIAYTSNGVLDGSFGIGTGKISIGTTGIYDFVIDSDDKIYVAYDNGSHQVTLARYRSNGAGLDTTFGTNGTVTNALNATVTAADQIRIGLDENEKVIVAGATTSNVKVARYSNAGVLDTTFGSSGFAMITDAGITLKDLLIGKTGDVDTHSVIALVGYKNQADDAMYMAWLNQNGAVDTSYNPTGVYTGEQGTIFFEANATHAIRELKSGVILDDGRIVVVGYETTSLSVDVPVIVRRYSQRYAPQQAQAPVFGDLGTLDPSLNGSGVFTRDLTSGTVDQYLQTIWSFDNGFVLVGGYGTISTDAVNSHFILAKLGVDGVVDTAFGTSGSSTTALRTANTNEYLYDFTVDYLGRIVAVGYSSSGVSLMRRYSSSGVLDTTFGDKSGSPARPTGTAAIAATQLYAVAMQLNGRFIAIGKDTDTNTGVIVGYDLEGVLDPTFGQNGKVYIADATALYSMVIDADDSILVAYKNGSGKANITRIQDNGLPYSMMQSGSSFGANGTLFDVFGANIAATDKIKVALDANRNVIVAASMENSNAIKIRRYLSSGQVDTTFNTDGSAQTMTLGVDADRPVLTRLLANQNGQYPIVGYIHLTTSDTDRVFVGQFSNAGAVDTTFNADGSQQGVNIFSLDDTSTQQKLMNAIVSPEGKVIAVGQVFVDGHYKPAGASLFDTQFSDEVDREPDFVAEGGFDTSFNTDGFASIYANGLSTPNANQEVRAVRQLASQKLMTVVSDGAQSWTVRVNQDGSNDTTYGSGNGILISQYTGAETVDQMQLDGAGNLLIVGTHSTQGGYVKRVLANGTMSPLFGGNLGDPAGTLYGVMDQVNGIAQLSNGKLIVVGNHDGAGVATMLTATSAVDTTFADNGIFTNGVNIASVAVDANNNIYFAIGYNDNGPKVRLVKMNSLGVLDTTFGSGGIVNAAITQVPDDLANIRIALDAQGYIVAASSLELLTGPELGVVRYTPAGIFDDQFNLGEQFDIEFSVASGAYLTGLVPLENGQILISGYQDNGDTINNTDEWFVVQLQHAGVYDDEFNTSGQTRGQVVFQVASGLQYFRHNQDIAVQVDGKIVLAGGESPATNQETPLLVRILNEGNVKAVAQFPGTANELPATTYPDFGTSGVAQSGVIANLVEGGFIVVDLQGRTNIGGLTQNGKLVVARFDGEGDLDATFGISGIATSPTISNLSNNGSLAIDSNGKIVIGGYASDRTLAAVRFTSAGVADTTFSGDGVVQTSTITNLSNGGFAAVDSVNRVLVGGFTSTNRLVVARFTAIGDADGTFGTSGIAQTGAISNVSEGGFVVTDSTNNVYVGGYATSGRLVIAKFTSAGVLDNTFGTAGIAQTGVITNLTGMGTLGIDTESRITIGGYTTDETLVVARFTPLGVLDTAFNSTGVAVTSAVTGLMYGGFVTIDNLNRVVVGGYVSLSEDENSMIATRFTADGVLDTTIATGGIASTGTISYLMMGGYTQIDNFDRILAGGMMVNNGNAQLIVAKLYSGDEIFVVEEDELTPQEVKVLHYGNNADRFRRMILVDYFLSLIENATVRTAVTERMNTELNTYITQYQGVPGFNLVWSLYKKDLVFEAAKEDLQTAHPTAVEMIESFFTRFNARRAALRKL